MRQLLILAIESTDALSIDHLSFEVPRLIQSVRAYGVLLDQPTGNTVKAAAKQALEAVATEQNVLVQRERSAAEEITRGLAQMVETMNQQQERIARLERFDAQVMEKAFGSSESNA